MPLRRLLLALPLLAASLLAAAPSRACMFDDEDNGFSLDTLDHYYPGGYSVVLRMVEARRDGTLKQLLDPNAPRLILFQRLTRAARSFEAQMRAAAGQLAAAEPPPAFALLLVESLLWVRFSSSIATTRAAVHVVGPDPKDLIVVMGDDVLAAVAAGQYDLMEAEQRGWVRLLGDPAAIDRFHHAYGRVGATAALAGR